MKPINPYLMAAYAAMMVALMLVCQGAAVWWIESSYYANH